MYFPKQPTKGLLWLLFLSNTIFANEPDSALNESKQLAVVKQWLPYYRSQLQLIFEYDVAKEYSKEPNANTLHRAIDRAGPTVAIIEAQIAYEDTTRTIGGYNPYKWKSWLGRYESDAGRFVFDLDREKRWERIRQRSGSFRSKPGDYGLSFGDGDLVINPDLKTGSARNNTFSEQTEGSVLIGQSGDFLVKRIRIYKVNAEPYYEKTAPTPMPKFYTEGSSAVSVPDNTLFLFETSLAALLILAFKRRWFKCG